MWGRCALFIGTILLPNVNKACMSVECTPIYRRLPSMGLMGPSMWFAAILEFTLALRAHSLPYPLHHSHAPHTACTHPGLQPRTACKHPIPHSVLL